MKILPVHSNYIVHKEKINHVNSIQNMSKPYAADTVSFGAKLVTAEENQHLGEVKTRIYHGKKGSVADYVEAAKVVLEEDAKIKELKLKTASLLFDPDVPCDLRKNERFISTNIFMLNNSQIDKINESKCPAKAILVADNKAPKINSEIKKGLVTIDYNHEIKSNTPINLKNYDIWFKKYVEADKITGGNSVHFDCSANVNHIDSANYVSLGRKVICKSINAPNVTIGKISKAENVTASTLALHGQAHADNATVKESLAIADKATLGNAVMTGDNAEVILSGNGSVTGKIEFKGKNGKVNLRKNIITGEMPRIKPEQVINGTIYENDILKAQNTGGKQTPKGFAKVAGMTDLKEILYTSVIEPLTKPELYKQYGLKPINGCLLYGPPGCGKTYIANALAEEAGRYFVEVRLSKISSPLQNLTNINLRRKFKEAERHAPSIIFLDEIESLAPCRESLCGNAPETSERVTELLTLMNNCKNKNIFIICASNEPQNIDSAIRRSGRIDKIIYVGVPDEKTREEIFKMELSNRLTDKDIDYKLISKKTENYISSDISCIVDEAARFALRERKPISTEHLLKAISLTRPSLTQSEIEYYKNKLESNYD